MVGKWNVLLKWFLFRGHVNFSGVDRCFFLEVTALELLLRKERDESADAEWIRWGEGPVNCRSSGATGACIALLTVHSGNLT